MLKPWISPVWTICYLEIQSKMASDEPLQVWGPWKSYSWKFTDYCLRMVSLLYNHNVPIDKSYHNILILNILGTYKVIMYPLLGQNIMYSCCTWLTMLFSSGMKYERRELKRKSWLLTRRPMVHPGGIQCILFPGGQRVSCLVKPPCCHPRRVYFMCRK